MLFCGLPKGRLLFDMILIKAYRMLCLISMQTMQCPCPADVQAWSVPHVSVGSFELNPTAFDLSDLYAALHPQNFS
jgi:hypothetical protein